MIFSKPVDIGYAVFIFLYLVDEVGWFLAQVVFGGGEQALLGCEGILGDDEANTGGNFA